MQSIETKYHGPTNTKGSRISVKTEFRKGSVSWNHALNSEQNHIGAALHFAKLWGWVKAGDKVVWGGKADGKGYNINIVCGYSTVEVK